MSAEAVKDLHGGRGLVEDIQVLQELAACQDLVHQLQMTCSVQLEQLFARQVEELEPLCQRRFELVAGKAEPRNEEMHGWVPPPSSQSQTSGGGKASGTAKGSAMRKGVGLPFFWLHVLLSEETLREHISGRDRHALEYLEDVRIVRSNSGCIVTPRNSSSSSGRRQSAEGSGALAVATSLPCPVTSLYPRAANHTAALTSSPSRRHNSAGAAIAASTALCPPTCSAAAATPVQLPAPPAAMPSALCHPAVDLPICATTTTAPFHALEAVQAVAAATAAAPAAAAAAPAATAAAVAVANLTPSATTAAGAAGSRVSPVTYTLELHFAPNPFFSSRVLRCSVLADEGAELFAPILWKEGKSLLLRRLPPKPFAKVSSKKAKKGKAGDAPSDLPPLPPQPALDRWVPCDSMFAAFTPSYPHQTSTSSSEPGSEPGSGPGNKSASVTGAVSWAATGGEAEQQRVLEEIRLALLTCVDKAHDLYQAAAVQGYSDTEVEDVEEVEGFELVSRHSGGIGKDDPLPLASQRVLHAVGVLQQRMDVLRDRYHAQVWAVQRACADACQRQYQQRRTLLLHDTSSSPAPLFDMPTLASNNPIAISNSTRKCATKDPCRPADTEAQAQSASPHAASSSNTTSNTCTAGAASTAAADSQTSVPGFWFRALNACPATAALIGRWDAPLLRRLADIRCYRDWERQPCTDSPCQALTLELEFLPDTPQLADGCRLLRKCYSLRYSPGDGRHGLHTLPFQLEESHITQTPVWSHRLHDVTNVPGLEFGRRPESHSGDMHWMHAVAADACESACKGRSPRRSSSNSLGQWYVPPPTLLLGLGSSSNGLELSGGTVQGAEEAAGVVQEPKSLFCLFTKGGLRNAFGILGDDKCSAAEAVTREEELLHVLMNQLLPNAYSLAMQVDASHGTSLQQGEVHKTALAKPPSAASDDSLPVLAALLFAGMGLLLLLLRALWMS